jgi:hypothetical protein
MEALTRALPQWGASHPWAASILVCLVTYCLLSKLLLEYPMLYHSRRSKSRPPLGRKGLVELIAHRGSRAEGLPENTIAAFKDAIAGGAQVLELDVWLSKDNKVGSRTNIPHSQLAKKHGTAFRSSSITIKIFLV